MFHFNARVDLIYCFISFLPCFKYFIYQYILPIYRLISRCYVPSQYNMRVSISFLILDQNELIYQFKDKISSNILAAKYRIVSSHILSSINYWKKWPSLLAHNLNDLVGDRIIAWLLVSCPFICSSSIANDDRKTQTCE